MSRRNNIALKKEKLKAEEMKIDEQLKAAGVFEEGLSSSEKNVLIQCLDSSKQIAEEEEQIRQGRESRVPAPEPVCVDLSSGEVSANSLPSALKKTRGNSPKEEVDLKQSSSIDGNVATDGFPIENSSQIFEADSLNGSHTSATISSFSSEEQEQSTNEDCVNLESDNDREICLKGNLDSQDKNRCNSPSLLSPQKSSVPEDQSINSQDLFDIPESEDQSSNTPNIKNDEECAPLSGKGTSVLKGGKILNTVVAPSSPQFDKNSSKNYTVLKGEKYWKMYNMLTDWHTRIAAQQQSLSFRAKWGPPLTVCNSLINGLDRPKPQSKIKKVKCDKIPSIPLHSESSDSSEPEPRIDDDDEDWEKSEFLNKTRKPIRKRGRLCIKKVKFTPTKPLVSKSPNVKINSVQVHNVNDTDDDIFLSDKFAKKVRLDNDDDDDKLTKVNVMAEIHREDSSLEELPDLHDKENTKHTDQFNTNEVKLYKLGRITPVKRTARKSFQLHPCTGKEVKNLSLSTMQNNDSPSKKSNVTIEVCENKFTIQNREVESSCKRSLEEDTDLSIVKKRRPLRESDGKDISSLNNLSQPGTSKSSIKMDSEVHKRATIESRCESIKNAVANKFGVSVSSKSLLGRLLKKDSSLVATVTTTLAKRSETTRTEVVVDDDEVPNMDDIQCPLCQSYFKATEIETHASDCNGPSDSSQDAGLFSTDFESNLNSTDIRRSYRNKELPDGS